MTASHGACSSVEIEDGEAAAALPIKFDDQVHVHFERHVLGRRQGVDFAGELAGVPFEPVGDVVAGVLFHVFSEDLVERIAPKCESKARGGPPCILCGATTGFLRIAEGDLGGATEANRASVPLFFAFAANAAGAGLVLIRRNGKCR